MIDVLHVLASTDRRGAEIFGLQLHRALSQRGWSSEVVALAPGSEPGLDVDCLGPTRRHLRTFLALRRRARRSAVVVAHGSTTLPLCAIALAGSGIPFVYRNIGDPDHWVTTSLRRLLGAVLLRRPRRIVALTPATADRIAAKYRLRADRIIAIPKGVALDEFLPLTLDRRRQGRELLGIDGDEPLVVYLGALGPEKRIENAIRAVEGLDGVGLAIVGDGPEREHLALLAATVAGVRVVGSTSEPSLVLSAADIVVLPSETEGLPGVLIEAGLVGVPVVATDVGFVADIVTVPAAGILVPPHDVEALRVALEDRLVEASPVPRDLRDQLRERFGLETVVSAWEGVLAPLAER